MRMVVQCISKGKTMRLKFGFAVLAVFALFLSGAVSAAAESGNATPSATNATGNESNH